MIIIMYDYINDEIYKRIDEFIKINPETNREELYQDVVNAFCKYGEIPEIVRKDEK